MRKWIRFFDFFLACLMLIGLAPQVLAEPTMDKNAPVDFVVVLDCSNSLFQFDPDRLCLNSFNTFIDQLPVENARVGVIGFGYAGKTGYPFSKKFTGESGEALDMKHDAKYVHEILPMSPTSGNNVKDKYKDAVKQAAEEAWGTLGNDELYSPVVPALAAAVDMLEHNGSVKGQAGIILVSDGVQVNRGRESYDYKTLGEHVNKNGWPVYCIDLNYANTDKQQIKAAQKLMDDICAASGKRHVGREYCANPGDVFSAFMHIFYDMWKYPEPVPADWPKRLNIPGSFDFDVPVLTSEVTVTLFGSGIESVTLAGPNGEQITVDQSDIANDYVVAVVRKDRYVSIKMICPEEGTWTCKVAGKGDAVLAVSMDLQEMGLTAVGTPTGDRNFQKQESVKVEAYFNYLGHEIHDRDIYEQTVEKNEVKLRVKHANGNSKEYPVQATRQGYFCELQLNDFPCGELTMQVVIEDGMFRSGSQVSNSLTYTTVAMPVTLTGKGPKQLEGYLNSSFDRIDLTQIFQNPDGDPITYLLSCDDGATDFQSTLEGQVMTISTGLVPGDYKVKLSAKDMDMTEPVVHEMRLSVLDRVPEIIQKPKKIELWTDHYGFQNYKEKVESVLDLNEYVRDPDGVQMTFTAELETPEVAEAELTGSSLKLSAGIPGKTVVHVTANDGISDVNLDFMIVSTSGKSAFWKSNWIYFLIAAVVLTVLIVTAIFLVKNKRVKGVWDITIDDYGNCGSIDQMDIAGFTAVGKKGRFLLKDLVLELLPVLDVQQNQMNVLSYFSVNGADKIELVGVIGKKGCGIAKIPDNVKVSINGVPARKSAKITCGTLCFTIQQPGDETLTIKMTLR